MRFGVLLLSSVVMAALSLSLISMGSDASGLISGQDLGWSDASFIGEYANDQAGSSISSAGDVNGDGYDDLLIGAMNNDEEDTDAGQVYLVFGNTSGWSMDINVSNADASFLGEHEGDRAGQSVAGVGDVNGDGYDDILIGAPENYASDTKSGQAYLILGKASGWSMDTSLSDADASFWGESQYERCGGCVAGAGDVNNDGYDDFLINAGYNSEGGINAGQTYLILGKRLGWSMDTRIDTADASFIGENPYDYAGASVDGAGDVNGDGYDDIIIGSRLNSEGDYLAGQTYLILGGNSGWNMDIDLSKVSASYIGEGYRDGAGMMVAGAGDVNGDGYHDFLIGSSNEEGGRYGGQVYLIFGKGSGWSMDTNVSHANASFLGSQGDLLGWGLATAGDVNNDGYDDFLMAAGGNDEGALDAGKTYLVHGRASGWSMDSNLSGANASFLGEEASDSSGVRSVSSAGDVNGDGYDDILIGAEHNDEGGTSAGQVYLILSDFSPPWIEEDASPANASTGDVYEFNLTVVDNRGIMNVSVEYWYGNSSKHSNAPLDLSSGDLLNGTWVYRLTILLNTSGPLHYIVHVTDTAWISIRSARSDVEVIDNDPPTFGATSPAAAETGLTYVFSIPVRDNIMLADVWVDYWYGEGEVTRLSMPFYAGDIRAGSMIVEDTLDDLHYVFGSSDISGNTNYTQEYTVEVVDINWPEIVNDGTKRTATTGDPHEFFVTAYDSLGLRGATLWYTFGEGELVIVEMEVIVVNPSLGTVLYSIVIDVPSDMASNITYSYEIEDLYGNVNRTLVDIVQVRDDDDPIIVGGYIPDKATTGDPFHIEVNASDNIDVMGAFILYSFGQEDPRQEEMPLTGWVNGIGRYSITFTAPLDSLEPFNSSIWVVDTSGNSAFAFEVELPIIDNDEPSIWFNGTVWKVMRGTDVEFSIDGHDNIGIVDVRIVMYCTSSGWEWWWNHSMDLEDNYVTTISIARNYGDRVDFHFWARDMANNTVVTAEYFIELYNPLPVLDLTEWSINEEEDAVLDLRPLLSDGNDKVSYLSVTVDNSTVTVDGLKLMARYDASEPDWTLVVTVADVEDEVAFDVTVHIVPVNDPPIISKLLPHERFSFRQGEEFQIAVDVHDEDDEVLNITWIDNGAIISHEMWFLGDGLRAGEHNLICVVTDGETTVEDKVTVTITREEEESPALGGVFVLLAILVGMAATMMRRKL